MVCNQLTREIVRQFVKEADLELPWLEVIKKYDMSFHIGSIVKHLWNGSLIDLEQALFHLERLKYYTRTIAAVKDLIETLKNECSLKLLNTK